MNKPVYIKTTNSICLTWGNEDPIIVTNDNSKFQKVIEAIEKQDWDTVWNLAKNGSDIEFISHGKMRYRTEDKNKVEVLKHDGTWWACPEELAKTLARFIEKDLPFEPLVNFAINLSENPSANSVKQLFNFVNANDYAITDDGCFIGYRKIRSDWKDIHSGTMDNSIGKIVEMPRNQVVEDPYQTCSAGLHVGSFEYTTLHYATSPQNKLVYVKVNPRDVVSVPVDYNNGKLRCCRFEVVGQLEQKEEIKDDLYDDENGFHSGSSYISNSEIEYEEFVD